MQSSRARFDKLSTALTSLGFYRSKVDHSVFVKHSDRGMIALVVYVDDIVITGDDGLGIVALKADLKRHFQTKDLGQLRDFLGIEVARSKVSINISQRKYVQDLLAETNMLKCRPADTPMDSTCKLVADEGVLLDDPGRYRRLVGKLIYLTDYNTDLAFPAFSTLRGG